jgi:hypothetical protein
MGVPCQWWQQAPGNHQVCWQFTHRMKPETGGMAQVVEQVLYLQSISLWLFWRWGSFKLFAWAGLEPRSSQSQPPK